MIFHTKYPKKNLKCAPVYGPLMMSCYTGFFKLRAKRVAISQHRTSVLFTSHPKDGLVVNLYIPHNRRTPRQAEEALGPISIPRG